MAGRAEFDARHHGGPGVHIAVVAEKNWRVITEAHYDLPDAFGCELRQLQANVAGGSIWHETPVLTVVVLAPSPTSTTPFSTRTG